LSPRLAAQLRAAVPYGRRMRLASSPTAAIASLLGIALARLLLAELNATPPEAIRLRFPYRGKPFSPGSADFSLSHSGAWLAGVACASARVGLDIESPAPAARMAHSPGRDLHDWTAREAMVKARGATLDQLRQVQVSDTHCLWQRERWALMRPAAPAGLIAALVSEQALDLGVRTLPWQALVAPVGTVPVKVACA
jgi:phosphopantetheinyl transferase